MAKLDISLLDDLSRRGLINQSTGDDGELKQHLASGERTLYCGFDPTADSLHIGSLVPLLTLKRFQAAGHRPIALVGGATGLVGDPSFKARERSLNDQGLVEAWVEKIQRQVAQFVDFDEGKHSALVVNNLAWTQDLKVLDFLRDVGKCFAVNNMMSKESVKQRIEREGEGISFAEFSYSLMQAMDFAELFKRHNCTLQIGGSDQWGNITGGVELTRRQCRGKVFGMTLPLVTKADGTKFGKTETGTIWLDPARTSPYAFYQFWLNAADADVYTFLRYFTFLPVDEIDALQRADSERSGKPEGQRVLAEQVTRLVHGGAGVAAAERISQALFCDDLTTLSESDFLQLRLDGLPSSELPARFDQQSLIQVLVDAGMAPSGKPVKDALGRRAVLVNGVPVGIDSNAEPHLVFETNKALEGRFFLVRLGKKNYHLFERAD